MFDMAIGAGAGIFPAEDVRHRPQHLLAERAPFHRSGEPGMLGMVPDILVATDAGLVAHRFERANVAGLAFVFQAVMGKAKRTGAPARVAYYRCIWAIAARQMADDRHRQENGQDRKRQDPGHGAFARQHAEQGEAAPFVKFIRFRIVDLPDRKQDHAVLVPRNRDPVIAETQLAAAARIDARFGDDASVNAEAKRAGCGDFDPAFFARGNRRMP